MRTTTIGAMTGIVLFFVIALPTALSYGGYAGILLAGGIFGNPLPTTILTKALVTFGMILGAIGVGSLFTVIGAMVGAFVSSIPTKLIAKSTI